MQLSAPEPTPRARINWILEEETLGKEGGRREKPGGERRWGGTGLEKVNGGWGLFFFFLKREVGAEETARNDCCNYGYI